MGSGLSQKYSNTYGSVPEENGASEVREEIAEYTTGPRIECRDPVSESASFYEQIGKGGEMRTIPGREGTVTKLDDGTRITYRVLTSSESSPAVDINVKRANTNINGQKIHFIKETK